MQQITFFTRVPLYQDTLMRYAHCLTKNDEDSKDLVQQTFLHALEHEAQYREDINLAGWLGLLLKRIWLDGLYKQNKTVYKKTREKSFAENDGGAKADLAQVLKDLESFNHRDANVLLLRAYGHSYEEIGLQLGINPKYLRIRVHKTRKRLKRLYMERKSKKEM